MAKETISIRIEAHVNGVGGLHDYREIKVQSTRGDVAKKLDEFCANIEANFEQ